MNVAAIRTPQETLARLRFGAGAAAEWFDVGPANWPEGRHRGKSEVHDVTVHDGRTKTLALDTHGFELLAHPRPRVDWNDPAAVAGTYYSREGERDTPGRLERGKERRTGHTRAPRQGDASVP